jgi:hypothetical protein
VATGLREPRDAAGVFEDSVRRTLDGPVLRYSQRLALLREAERLRVGRFEANLIIAGVLYREGVGQEYEMKPVRAGWGAPILVAVVVQGVIGAGWWWVMGL